MNAPAFLGFRVEVRFDEAEVVVSVHGDVEPTTAPTLRGLLRALLDQDHQPIVLDLSQLTFMDASGLDVIADVAARLAASSGVLVVRSAPAVTRRILRITGVDDLVTMETDGQPGLARSPRLATLDARMEDVEDSELVLDLAKSWEREANQKVLDAALGLVTTLTGATVAGANGASVTLERAGQMTTVASTDTTIRRMDDHQYETGQGPCLSAAAEGRTFHVSALADEKRWPDFVPRAMHEGIGAILSTPLIVDDRPLGALNVYSNSSGPFGDREQHLASLFADQASGLLAGADTASAASDEQFATQIRSALAARETIAHAQGVYMAREQITPAMAALTLLRAARANDTTVLATVEGVLRSQALDQYQTQEQLSQLLDSSGEAFVAMNADGVITRWNDQAAFVFGWSRREALGAAVAELIIPPAYRDGLATFLATRESEVFGRRAEMSALHRDGREFPVELTLWAHPGADGTRSLYCFAHDITERVATTAQLEFQALHDPLTGVANRALLMDRLAHALARTDRTGIDPGVLFVDLDDFKSVNDRLGHSAGDQLLRSVAERLEALLRPSDTLSRLGGDEFVIVLDEVQAPGDAAAVAARIAQVLDAPIDLGGERFDISASVGIALAGRGASAEGLVADADAAMYTAKRRGPGQFELFDAATRARASRDLPERSV